MTGVEPTGEIFDGRATTGVLQHGAAVFHRSACCGSPNGVTMRSKLSEEVTGLGLSTNALLMKPNSEMSASLPNLCNGIEELILQQATDGNPRNSLSNIFSKYHSKLHDMREGKDGNLAESVLRVKALSAEDGLSFKSSVAVTTPIDVTKSKLLEFNNDIVVNGQPSHLSAVLENLPLVYIPQTKRLVPMTSDIVTQQSESLQCNTSMQSMSPNKTLENQDCNTSLDVTLTDCLDSTVCCESDRRNDTQSNNSITFSNHSDAASVQSDNTVKSQQESLSQGMSIQPHLHIPRPSNSTSEEEEGDSESANELTKLRTSSQHSHKSSDSSVEGGTSSIAREDESSFSSVSSLGISTDISATTTSSSEADASENAKPTVKEIKNEQEFVEINLNSRNSYERAPNSAGSQDSGIGDVQQQLQVGQAHGLKSKRKGFTAFLSRYL